jgi:hypothetical protein
MADWIVEAECGADGFNNPELRVTLDEQGDPPHATGHLS